MTGYPKELRIEAAVDKLPTVLDFVESCLSAVDCPIKAMMQVNVAVEEIFVNIASYAYAPDQGYADIRVDMQEMPQAVTISFSDSGIPYNPLAKADPDVTLSAAQRQIGGLGIYMTKQLMDRVEYVHENGRNILTLTKQL